MELLLQLRSLLRQGLKYQPLLLMLMQYPLLLLLQEVHLCGSSLRRLPRQLHELLLLVVMLVMLLLLLKKHGSIQMLGFHFHWAQTSQRLQLLRFQLHQAKIPHIAHSSPLLMLLLMLALWNLILLLEILH